jgi:hypothetical protein
MVGGLVGGVIVAGALALALAAALAGLPGWLGERASALVREVGYPEAVVTVERVGLDGLEGRLRLGDEGAAGGQAGSTGWPSPACGWGCASARTGSS